MKTVFIAICMTLITMSATSQTQLTEHTLTLPAGAGSPLASLGDVEWMCGRWVGKGFGGVVEENWLPAMSTSMIGTFRMINDSGVVFYEMLVLEAVKGTLVYGVRHFNPDFTGWEEKESHVEFPLVKVEGTTIWFRGLTIKREGKKCTHYLAMKQKDGSYQEAVLVYELASI